MLLFLIAGSSFCNYLILILSALLLTQPIKSEFLVDVLQYFKTKKELSFLSAILKRVLKIPLYFLSFAGKGKNKVHWNVLFPKLIILE